MHHTSERYLSRWFPWRWVLMAMLMRIATAKFPQ